MEGPKEEIEHPDQNYYGRGPHIGSSIPETPTEMTDVLSNEQLQSEVLAVRDGTSLDGSEQGLECGDLFCSTTSVKIEEDEEKDIAVKLVDENSENWLNKAQEVKESSFQDLSNVDREETFLRDRNSPSKNIGVDTVSDNDKVSLEVRLPSTSTNPQYENFSDTDDSLLEISELPNDLASDIGISSINTSISSSQISKPIEIPSTSKDSLDFGHEQSSPKRPNFGSDITPSINTFYPRNPTSTLKKLPNPFKKGHHVFLRDSPESSDYGGSPDSLEDPFLMEALCDSENKETEDLQSGSIEEYVDDQPPPEPIKESLDVLQPEPVAESRGDQPLESTEDSFDDQPHEPVSESPSPRDPTKEPDYHLSE